ncbi:MAG: hypothetical protein OXT65_01405 [Alphaproteobacteria bacterium]|nr:hypothetical protein [Alphaproteobacteria bacterium]
MKAQNVQNRMAEVTNQLLTDAYGSEDNDIQNMALGEVQKNILDNTLLATPALVSRIVDNANDGTIDNVRRTLVYTGNQGPKGAELRDQQFQNLINRPDLSDDSMQIVIRTALAHATSNNLSETYTKGIAELDRRIEEAQPTITRIPGHGRDIRGGDPDRQEKLEEIKEEVTDIFKRKLQEGYQSRVAPNADAAKKATQELTGQKL